MTIGEVGSVGCFFLEMTMYLHFAVNGSHQFKHSDGQHQLEGQESLFVNE